MVASPVTYQLFMLDNGLSFNSLSWLFPVCLITFTVISMSSLLGDKVENVRFMLIITC